MNSMMDRNHFLSFSFIFFAFFFLLLSDKALAIPRLSRLQGIALVETLAVCIHTDYPSLCVSSVESSKEGHDSRVAGVAKSSIQATIQKTIQAKAHAASLIAVSKGDKMQESNLKVCREVYNDALSNLHTSLKNLKARSYADLRINLSDVLSDCVTCDDTFAETPGVVSPLSNVDAVLTKFAKNNLALASNLKN